jgi:hypothetical protein
MFARFALDSLPAGFGRPGALATASALSAAALTAPGARS